MKQLLGSLMLLADAQRGGRAPGTPPGPDISIDLPPQTPSLSSIVPSRTKIGPSVSLPATKQAARLLFNDQYSYIGTIFAFADRTRFEQLLDEVYSRRLDITDSASCLAHAKLLVIMAFGQFYSVNQGLGSVSMPGSEYFAAAVQLLPEIHGPPSIRFVETLCLVGYFMQNLTYRAAAFAYVGLAVRMAISLGMHEEVPEPDRAALTGEELEYRRRVWWSVYSMDRILTVKSGNPVMIHDDDISMAMPSRLPSEPEYCPAVTLAFYTELSRILGDIARLYAPRSSSSPQKLQEAMHDLAGRLQRWHDALPQQLRFDYERMHDTRESVSTLLHYYQCINMTVRPFVYTLVRRRLQGSAEDRARDWREGLPAATQDIVVWCIDAARKTIRMMKLANKTRLVANYGYMDTEHALSAAILLLMVCAAFPSDPDNTASLRDALALLASMGDRGNRHIAERFQVLRQLAAELVPDLVLEADSEAEPGAVPPPAVAPGVVDGPPEEQPMERFWDQVVVGAEGVDGAFEYNQCLWDCVYDDMMQDME
ncbi:hypothetical protein NEMBOFW57_004605 [Staphylotrichum longicolle]|uniref:Xylanolytic transcriptional activator regulatory domain-containing protein n=1 Tax=Staphylotrichum longicolle TaxID=669026 RepID=A0AAD4F8D3_9PEZI|nr:hypothetical protein NEMBOFW57_004605 [Staphylotrichum longicolle]